MALRGRNIENFDAISLTAWSRGLPICVSSTSFQKNEIGWPQQPLTEKVLKFNMNFIFYNSTQLLAFGFLLKDLMYHDESMYFKFLVTTNSTYLIL